jgi:hypothetical protein
VDSGARQTSRPQIGSRMVIDREPTGRAVAIAPS